MAVHDHSIFLKARIIPAQRRAAIEDEIETLLHRAHLLIARLDRVDAPFADMEDDDPAGDSLDERGEAEDWRPDGAKLPLPVFAVDQTTGPLNGKAAYQAWHQHVMEA